jgi:hypothetical protein
MNDYSLLILCVKMMTEQDDCSGSRGSGPGGCQQDNLPLVTLYSPSRGYDGMAFYTNNTVILDARRNWVRRGWRPTAD